MHISSYNGQKVLALLWTASLTSLILPAPSTSVAISATPALQLRASSVVGMLNSGDMGKYVELFASVNMRTKQYFSKNRALQIK